MPRKNYSMNDIIKQLEPQCWEHNEFGLNFNYRKFAELIIKETMQVVANQLPSNQYLDVAHEVIEHFRVEE